MGSVHVLNLKKTNRQSQYDEMLCHHHGNHVGGMCS